MIGKSFRVCVVILIAFLAECTSNSIPLGKSDDSANAKSFKRASLRDSQSGTAIKSDFALPIQSLVNFKNFAIANFLESNGSLKRGGTTLLKSMFSSLVTSTGTIRAMEHLQTLKATLLNQFRKP